MSTEQQRFRWLSTRLPPAGQRRLVVVTGARQTGKTTLARAAYPDLRYVNLDDLEAREALRATRTTAWARSVGPAILDEAQKEPSVFEKVKYAFDEGSLPFSALLGSSRILLLSQVRETLAGRAFLYDLWPLMLSELRAGAASAPEPPLFDALLRARGRIDPLLEALPTVLLGDEEEARRAAFDHLSLWGGMPALLALSDEDRRLWLRSYQQTFLERDLTDLVRLFDLHPFRTLQQLAMLRTGQLLSYAELARDAAISPTTARRYLEYLDLSYQVVFVRPYTASLTSRLVKSPRLYWLDLGLLRQGTGQWGPLTGALFETLVVSECQKWISTLAAEARLYSYRTVSGLEVDLLLETPHGVLAIETKNRGQAVAADARSMLAVAQALGRRWLGGLVVYRGRTITPVRPDASIWAVPAHRLF
jgi:predicted AAA+ superfamily ATPase